MKQPITFDMVSLLMVILIILVILALFALTIYVLKSNEKFKNMLDNFMKNQKEDIESSIAKSNEIMLNTIKSLINNTVPTAVSEAIEKPEPTLFNVFLGIRNSIKDNAVSCLNSIEANRLAIYLFHNGTTSTHGVKFFKMSCVGETITRGSGIRERMIEHSAININILDDTILDIINNGSYVVISDNYVDDMKYKLFISNPKIKYSIIIPIYDVDNTALGLVCAELPMEYFKDKADKQKDTLKAFVDQIVPILSYANYSNAASKGNTGNLLN